MAEPVFFKIPVTGKVMRPCTTCQAKGYVESSGKRWLCLSCNGDRERPRNVFEAALEETPFRPGVRVRFPWAVKTPMWTGQPTDPKQIFIVENARLMEDGTGDVSIQAYENVFDMSKVGIVNDVPEYPHDCTACVFLGCYINKTRLTRDTGVYTGGLRTDLYHCPNCALDGGTIISRFGNEGHEYASLPAKIIEEKFLPLMEDGQKHGTFLAPLVEGLRRKKEADAHTGRPREK